MLATPWLREYGCAYYGQTSADYGATSWLRVYGRASTSPFIQSCICLARA